LSHEDTLRIGDSILQLIKGDITRLEVDAIVNAADSSLRMGGGVAGAILRRGGKSIQDECDAIGYCPVGGAVMTTGGNLKARYVIHAVGPRQGEGNEDEKLRSATVSCLKLADENNLTSIAFPAISTGIFGFPKERCANIMLSTVKSYLASGKTTLRRVILCLYDDATYDIFRRTLDAMS
jgi:O-acetyl-ADP-ribose deacetylase (regulator of RNase III)